MLIRWKRSLALSLGLLVTQAWAQDSGWRVPPHSGSSPVQINPPAVTLGRPTNADQTSSGPGAAASSATLGKPVPLGPEGVAGTRAFVDGQVQPTGFRKSPVTWPTVRAAGTDEEEVQPAAVPTPARSGPIAPLFTWTPVGDEVAPPPRVDGPANPPPPRVAEFFPAVQPVPALGGAPAPGYGGMPAPAFGGVPVPAYGVAPAPAVVDGVSLGVTGAYPGNELYFRAEGLLWWTKGAPVPTLGTSFAGIPTTNSGLPGTAGTSAVIGNDHFADRNRGGVRIMAGYWFDDDHLCGIEGGFFVLGKTTRTQNFSSTGPINLAIPYINAATGAGTVFPIAGSNFVPGVGIVGPDAGTLRLRYSSSLFGYEVNFRGVCCSGPCGFIDGLVGFRGLGLDESLNLTATTSATSLGGGPLGSTERIIGDSFRVQNRFYGAQIGTVWESRCGCWVLDVTAKVGLGVTQEVVNITGATVDLRTGAGNMAYPNTGFFAQPSNSGRHVQSDFAVVPEVGATLGYQFTCRLRGFVGYNFLYWSRVVRPADQLSQSINPAQFPRVGGVPMGAGTPVAPVFAFHTTDFWAQGLTFGLEWRY